MYQEQPPAPALHPWVVGYWAVTARATMGPPVLPDGCMDLLFARDEPQAYVVGNLTQPMNPSAGAGWLGIRFRPGAIRHWVSGSLDAFTDSRQPAALHPLADQLLGLPLEQAAACLDQWLLARRPDVTPWDRLLAQSAAAPQAWTTARLAAATGYSIRQLQRHFLRDVGIAPRLLLRTLRMQQALAHLRQPQADLLDVALRTGYHDLAHLTHELQELTHTTPGAYRALHLS